MNRVTAVCMSTFLEFQNQLVYLYCQNLLRQAILGILNTNVLRLCEFLFLTTVPAATSRWRFSHSLTPQHGVLVLGCADQPADAVNHLALRVQLFLLGFLAKKDHWKWKQEG